MLKIKKKGFELKKITEINNFIGKTNLKIEEFIRQKRNLELDFTLEELEAEIKSTEKKNKTKDY